jgi:hypothetical protein
MLQRAEQTSGPKARLKGDVQGEVDGSARER